MEFFIISAKSVVSPLSLSQSCSVYQYQKCHRHLLKRWNADQQVHESTQQTEAKEVIHQKQDPEPHVCNLTDVLLNKQPVCFFTRQFLIDTLYWPLHKVQISQSVSDCPCASLYCHTSFQLQRSICDQIVQKAIKCKMGQRLQSVSRCRSLFRTSTYTL